eukprot:7588720-Pyramimonas_sp.AAC.1
MINAVREICEEPQVEDGETHALEGDFAEARKGHVETIAGGGNNIVNVIPATDTTSKILTGKWVDTYRADGSEKSRWATRGFEQQ